MSGAAHGKRNRVGRPANDNAMPSAEIAARLDWVWPVFVAMRAATIPDEVAQATMTFLLERMDEVLGP